LDVEVFAGCDSATGQTLAARVALNHLLTVKSLRNRKRELPLPHSRRPCQNQALLDATVSQGAPEQLLYAFVSD
jgi:hypothetical protein